MSPDNGIVFVLVEPVYPGNIGAAARILNNFGFRDLRLVGTIPKKEDHYLAVHSEEIMDNIRVYDDLKQALSDTGMAIAMTRRSGKKKKTDLHIKQLKDFTSGMNRGKTALVFGRETYGLKDEEIDLCPVRCLIPTDPGFSSLNLAQAVAITAYELFEAGKEEKPELILADRECIGHALSTIRDRLTSIGYFENGDPVVLEKQLQSMFSRSYTTEENLNYLTKIFERIEVIFTRQKEPELKRIKK